MKSQIKILIMGMAVICVSLLFNNHAYAKGVHIPNWASVSVESQVTGSTILDDNRTLVTSHQDGTLRFWDISNGQLVNKVKVHNYMIGSVASVGNSIYYDVSYAGFYKYDISTGEIKRIRDINRSVYYNLMGLDDSLLTYIDRNDLYVFDTKTGKDKWEFSAQSNIKDIAYDKKSKHLAISSGSSTIDIKDMVTGRSIKTFKLYEHPYYDSRILVEYIGSKLYVYYRNELEKYEVAVYDIQNNYSKEKSSLPKVEYLDSLAGCSDERFVIVNNNMYDLQQDSLKIANNNQWGHVRCLDKTMVNISYKKIEFYDLKELAKLKSIQNIKIVEPDAEWVVNNKYDIQVQISFNDGSVEELGGDKLTWYTNNFYVANVVNGQFDTREAGDVTLSTSYLGHKLSITKQVYNHIPLDKDQYHVMAKKSTADTKKVWEINLTRPVSYKDIEDKNIVITDTRGYLVPTLYVIDGAAKDKIKIIPTRSYKVGEVYTLWINGLYAEDGNQALANNVRMDFEIKK